jgi:hypothetical protein
MNRELNEALARFLEGEEGYDDRAAILAAARWAASFPSEADVEAAATIHCQHDNMTGPEVAVDEVPCDVHRRISRAALEAVALDRKEP